MTPRAGGFADRRRHWPPGYLGQVERVATICGGGRPARPPRLDDLQRHAVMFTAAAAAGLVSRRAAAGRPGSAPDLLSCPRVRRSVPPSMAIKDNGAAALRSAVPADSRPGGRPSRPRRGTESGQSRSEAS